MAKSDIGFLPFYQQTAAYASENGELEMYRKSLKENIACKEAIEKAISDNFDGMNLKYAGVKGVIAEFGAERVQAVLATTVQVKAWDGRFSASNKEWAKSVPTQEPMPHPYNPNYDRRNEYAVSSHPAVLDGFIRLIRQEIERSIVQTQENTLNNNKSAKEDIFMTTNTTNKTNNIIGGNTSYKDIASKTKIEIAPDEAERFSALLDNMSLPHSYVIRPDGTAMVTIDKAAMERQAAAMRTEAAPKNRGQETAQSVSDGEKPKNEIGGNISYRDIQNAMRINGSPEEVRNISAKLGSQNIPHSYVIRPDGTAAMTISKNDKAAFDKAAAETGRNTQSTKSDTEKSQRPPSPKRFGNIPYTYIPNKTNADVSADSIGAVSSSLAADKIRHSYFLDGNKAVLTYNKNDETKVMGVLADTEKQSVHKFYPAKEPARQTNRTQAPKRSPRQSRGEISL